MAGRLRFFVEFLRSPQRVGAVTPSSRALAKLMVDAADVKSAGVIVEFGAGTGVFTEVIEQTRCDGSVFFAIEINPDLAAMARRRCPTVRIYEDCVTNAAKYLEREGAKACDCIVSGLPWAAFDETLQDRILDTTVDILESNGRFVTFSYIQCRLLRRGRLFRSKLDGRFQQVTKTRIVWRNFPPAFVYCAQK